MDRIINQPGDRGSRQRRIPANRQRSWPLAMTTPGWPSATLAPTGKGRCTMLSFSNRGGGRWTLPAAAALAAALVLAGCGADRAASATTTTSTAGLDVSPSALALQQQFVKVVKQVGPSVVLIRTSEGLGSGIVFDAKGDVVTNDHVVDNASGFQVTLADGKQYPARPVGGSRPTTWRCSTSTPPGCTRPASPTPRPWPWAT